ncbi:DUF3891 family protein [Halobacillus salinarum]|uniref:DUF3891 family protein n=1 Tax=Halobacillus salinarum TaxID=2932257 RepID=A0ABY4EKL6_9BACI|nr:DUF3891 family protein [Halobacillus salinarum]UOQ44704.1 DUF3891 family protein [Halobacillus salinarum]
MIVHEQESHFLMITQHDHALVSGEIVLHWKSNFLLRSKLREEADWAIGQHDRAWIPLDENPLWNEEEQRPYTFVDYPLKEKLEAYRRGINEVAKRTLYGAMLCSMHYQSFFSTETSDEMVKDFLNEQEVQQHDFYKRMRMEVPKDIVDLHFKRLQFCDDLSLYACMNAPGVDKEKELPWFKNGFPQSFDFAPEGMLAHWKDESRVAVEPFPFENSFQVVIPYKQVAKKEIESIGLKQAYYHSPTKERVVWFVK